MDKNTFNTQTQLFDSYISSKEPKTMPATTYLRKHYLTEKSPFLYSLLGDSLYKEIPNVEITTTTENNLNDLINHSPFIKALSPKFRSLITPEALSTNIVDFNINYAGVQIKKGMKTMRALRKISEALHISPREFESFRKTHAQILSSKTLRGTLCLSALPMDYVTLSDNNENWRSCYNWSRSGLYHPATLALLSAPNTIVAYLKHPTKEYQGWNSKLWRQLIYVDSDIIIPSRAYPYNHAALESQVLSFLLSLHPLGNRMAKIAVDWIGDREGSLYSRATGLRFSFSNMKSYCDFASEQYVYMVNRAYPTLNYEIPYDGEVHCLSCGEPIEIDEDNPNAVSRRLCAVCRPIVKCASCGGTIHTDKETYYDPTTNKTFHYECFDSYCYF